MLTLAALKQDMESNRNLGDIIEVLKTAAIIQFRAFQLREKPNDDFAREAESCFNVLAEAGIKHPYILERQNLPLCIFVVTSDEGFLGELNTLLINAAVDQLKSKNDKIIVLGERGAKYLEDMNQSFTFFPGFSEEVKYGEIEGIRDYLVKTYMDGCAKVLIVYPKFLSLTAQKIEVFQFLPFYIRPQQKKDINYLTEEMLMEPTANRVLETLIQLWGAFKILEIFWSSKQSEYGARIMHLEASTQELSHLNQRVRFVYFRQVHTLKDKSIREISASKILLDRRID